MLLKSHIFICIVMNTCSMYTFVCIKECDALHHDLVNVVFLFLPVGLDSGHVTDPHHPNHHRGDVTCNMRRGSVSQLLTYIDKCIISIPYI